MGQHALLSASSSHRWLACPPSARLCEQYEDQTSEYAAEGTAAHALCEYKLKKALGMEAADPTECLSFYDEEMEQCADSYVSLCEMCLKEGRLTPVQEVHHILPVSKGGTHARDNLMSLCQSCHTKIHHDLGDR